MLPGNYMPEACKGCVVVHGAHPQIFGTSTVGPGAAPFQWNPEDKIFTVANSSRRLTRFTYLTFSGVEVFDKSGTAFERGITRDEDGSEELVTTFVVVLKPRTSLSLGRVNTSAPGADFEALSLSPLAEVPRSLMPRGPHEEEAAADEEEEEERQRAAAAAGAGGSGFLFPLPAGNGPYLCTQGVGGHLTHFFPESFHAIDLRCAVGTPLLCIASGIVKEVAERHCCGGIHVSNLSKWNAMSVELDCGLLVEYVHTGVGSSKVKPGDKVRAGQVLCETGDIGFAPEPHVHIELHRAADPEGPSEPLRFRSVATPDAGAFVPQAGKWYTVQGEEEAPEAECVASQAERMLSQVGPRPGVELAGMAQDAGPAMCLLQKKRARN